MIRTVLVAAGLKDGDGLILFRRNDAHHCCSYQALMLRSTENASLSHGGTDRTLTPSDLILFDIGGTLNGYYSELTRTFALRELRIPTQTLEM